ncbi:NADPH:quinone reductase [Thermodesulfobacteriota bacterium]
MKAIRVDGFGGPEVLQLQDVDDLQAGPGQVLISVKAVGVNPVDTYVRSGEYAKLPPLPYTPGSDSAGVVAAVGDGVTGWAVGDRVYTSGTVTGAYAEQTLCVESQVHPLPEPAGFPQGAAVGIPYAIAYRALFNRAAVKPGETLLVHGGTGGAGLATLQLGRSIGMTVIATGGTEEGRELLRQQGARYVLDHKDPEHFVRVMEATGGNGVDVILEMLANVNLGKDLTVLAPGGRVVVIGSRGTVEINPRDTMIRDASIMGVLLFNAGPDELRQIHAALGAGLEQGFLRPVVGKELPLSDAAQAHKAVMQSRALGKIVLTT